jgi:hypothetical protein
VRLADAARAAFSYLRVEPFPGEDPIHFGFRWNVRRILRIHERNRMKLWTAIAGRISKLRFINPDGAPLSPDKIEFIELEERRVVLTFER